MSWLFFFLMCLYSVPACTGKEMKESAHTAQEHPPEKGQKQCEQGGPTSIVCPR